MSSWAQSYTAAATWQLKHQVAYWKARAKALEYQNRVLHDTIRQNFFKDSEVPTSICESENSSEADEENGDDENGDDENGYDECEDEQEEDFEVSEEFIEFLRKNAKYKEDAKKEKERLRALREAENEAQEEEVENYEERQAKFKNLYGDGWEKIMCLETSVLCDFMNECDKEQPQYWPNIPFNFDGC